MDVDHIPAGVDFTEYLHSQVAACDIFLAVIGPNWLDAKDDSGRRRFDNPDDFVTIEIAAALARNIRVIPVLVDGARTPKADKLPDSIRPLVRRNAVEVRNTNFGRDAEALANKVGEALKGARPATGRWPSLASGAAWLMVPGRWRTVAGTAMALLLVGWIGLYQLGVPVWAPWAEQPDPARADKTRAAADTEAQRKAAEAEQQRLAAIKEEEQRQAKAADLEAKLKAAEAEQRRLAADAEAKRRAAEAEQKRLAAVKADEERKAKAVAEAEAKRKAEEAEQQRLAAAKAEEERRKRAEAEARARYSSLVKQSKTEIDNRDYDRAIASASEAMRLDPTDATPVVNRGLAYSRKGDSNRAIADYTEAIRLNPNYGIAFHNRGAAYLKKGDNRRAIADFNEAIRLDPMHALAFCNRGIAKLRINDASGNQDKAKARELGHSICR
jgi:tetratricopeptide (TPR) repeat protein